MGCPGVCGLCCCFDNMVWSIEVRLPNFQMDQIFAIKRMRQIEHLTNRRPSCLPCPPGEGRTWGCWILLGVHMNVYFTAGYYIFLAHLAAVAIDGKDMRNPLTQSCELPDAISQSVVIERTSGNVTVRILSQEIKRCYRNSSSRYS